MEQLPTWLAAAITAAGMTTVYNAEDWERAAPADDASKSGPQAAPFSPPMFG